jgi:hypothetical protein
MTNSGKDASVICENLNTVLREFNIPALKRIKTPKKGGGRWKDKLTTMERLEAQDREVTVSNTSNSEARLSNTSDS